VFVGHCRRGQRRNQQGDESQSVGDDIAGALVQSMADQHADSGADEHCRDVEHRAEAAEHS